MFSGDQSAHAVKLSQNFSHKNLRRFHVILFDTGAFFRARSHIVLEIFGTSTRKCASRGFSHCTSGSCEDCLLFGCRFATLNSLDICSLFLSLKGCTVPIRTNPPLKRLDIIMTAFLERQTTLPTMLNITSTWLHSLSINNLLEMPHHLPLDTDLHSSTVTAVEPFQVD